jgi:hypothetical protein
MATNLALEDKLILEAQSLGRHKSKKDAVNSALREYIAHRRQKEIAAFFGGIDFSQAYDYKRARKGRASK